MTEYERYVREERGYSRQIDVIGFPGASELAMYTGYTDKEAEYALLRPDSDNYAYVKFVDGSFLDGCFTLFVDGTFSLS